VFLKSLTLRGFKSFAEKTHLEFEPGITVIVGPNGSGKSNVVDALSWVLGTHSAKSLRGGSMADVIFAGSPGKAALGRAAVEINIDNTAGTLPIEFSEVTVSRSMFASGENEYAINAVDCRLLDVQELLSDTGLGRENHTIVGQGQLDAILNAKPEDRRAFIEEAAGILKHRRRKERALRKLAQMDAHVERLTDVLRELRRNLRPLERQAEAAAKHAKLQGQLREVRITRALREFAILRAQWELDETALRASDERLGQVERDVAAARNEEASIQGALDQLSPAAREAIQTHFHLSNLVERFRGLTGRIEERRLGLVEAVEEPVAGRDPQRLREDAELQRQALAELDAQRDVARQALEVATGARREAEQARRAHEQAAAAEARRRTEARERLLRWEGEVAALRSSLAQAASEEGRLASQVSGMTARREELQADIAGLQKDIQRLDAQETALAEHLAAAEAVLARKEAAADEATRRERDLERQRASLEARADALRVASAEATEGASALMAASAAGDMDGVVGPLADHVKVADGMAKAVAAALGPLGDALVVASTETASRALGFVREHRSGRALLLVATPQDAPAPAPIDLRDQDARPLVEALEAEPSLLRALGHALAGVYVTINLTTAAALAKQYPGFVFVTAAGEVVGPRGWAGGSASANSAVLLRAAAEQAEAQLAVVSDELLRAHRRLGDADRELTTARHELDAANAAMQESDNLITAAAERMNRLGKELATCQTELGVLLGQQEDLAREIATQRERLGGLESRGVDPVDEPGGDGPDYEAERLDDELAHAREHEVQARLAASAADQQSDEVRRRIEGLQREADDVERQLVEREQRRQRRMDAIERCGVLTEIAVAALARAEQSLETAAAERDRLDRARAEHERRLGVIRAALREQEELLGQLRDVRHNEDMARAELRHTMESVATRLRDEFDLDADAALVQARAAEDAGEDGPLAGGEERDTALAEDEERLIRKVSLLGTINPLALEEFHQLQERHDFLTEQLADLRQSKQDLLKVVDAVDERIREVFAAAFADVAEQFESIFPRLFPGGEGKLILTDPDDMLVSGVDVEARPPGKRVKRLSLLSGGERSLTALAVLFAIFAARPSPFYVLDEVEAALDDVNLQRLLDVIVEFRASSQLIIVTHQKRTMEIADTLYGVSMQSSGVSKVVSQRLREPLATATN
jgi:chromosome segregation protein